MPVAAASSGKVGPAAFCLAAFFSSALALLVSMRLLKLSLNGVVVGSSVSQGRPCETGRTAVLV